MQKNGKYHNKIFAKLCEEFSLECEKVNLIGYATTGHMLNGQYEKIQKEFTNKYNLVEVASWFELQNLIIIDDEDEPKSKSKSNLKVYICPICGAKARAKNQAKLICGECVESELENGNDYPFMMEKE